MRLAYLENLKERLVRPHKPELGGSLPEEEAVVPGAESLEGEDVVSPSKSAKASNGDLTEDQRYYVELAEALDL